MINHSLSGNKIEAARKKRNLSQAKLGEIVGVSRASISLYETGAGSPSYKVLTKLSEALEIPFGDLAGLGDGGQDYPGTAITRHLNEQMNELRSGLIKQHLGRKAEYIDVPFYGDPVYLADNGIMPLAPNYVADGHAQWPSVPVLAIPGVDYSNACVVTLQDSTMKPRYSEESQHVFHPINDKVAWQYLTGLYGFSIDESIFIVRRIVSNKASSMVLVDANGNELIIKTKNVLMIWRVGQTVHMAAEG